MANPFDQFDEATPSAAANPFDQFDAAKAPVSQSIIRTSPQSFAITDRTGKRTVFTAPTDAQDDDIRQLAIKASGSNAYRNAAINHDVAAPSDDSRLGGFALGAIKPIDNIAGWLDSIPGIHQAGDWLAHATGLPTTDEANAMHDAARAGNDRTGYQLLGNIAGTLPTAALPGGAVVQGAAAGALLSDRSGPLGVAEDAGIGALGGVAGNAAGRVLGGAVGGIKAKGAQLLTDAGVPLTIGQIGRAAGNLGGRIVGGAEDFVSGLPVGRELVRAAQDRGVEGLNVAAGNRILANIGDALPAGTQAGHDMLTTVQNKLSNKYQQLVPNLSAKIDMPAAEDFTAARALADQASRGPQLEKVIKSVMGNRVQTADGEMTLSGQQLKDAESELTRLYGKYANSTGDEGLYGDAIDQVRQGLRNAVMRSNPDQAGDLQALNTGWAQLKSLRKAVASGSDKAKAAGVASPGAILRQSANKGFRDPLAEEAVDVLPNRTPDSGTVGRAITASALLGSGYAEANDHPYAAAALGAIGGLSSRPGQIALNKLAFAPRAPALTAAGQTLGSLARYAPQVVTPMLVGSKR